MCITGTKLLLLLLLYSILGAGEWSYSTDRSNVERAAGFPARVIGVDKSAGVRNADGTLNDSWCRLGYL